MNNIKISCHSRENGNPIKFSTLQAGSRNKFGMTSTRAFTLIELVVSITILSVIMLSVFMIYSNLIQINKRLEALRIVQENIRNITEQIASDVREK